MSQGFSTRAIHVGQDPDPATRATVVPIYATSTYTQAAPGQHKGYEYSRSGNPTRTALETCLASLEGGERGLAFASGLAASTAVLAGLLKPGDEVAAAADLYGGTFRLLERVFQPWGLKSRYTDDAAIEGFAKIITPATKMIWIETPTNPLLQILDIAALANWPTSAAPSWSSTTPSPRPICNNRSPSARISSFTVRRNTSADIPMSSAAPPSA